VTAAAPDRRLRLRGALLAACMTLPRSRARPLEARVAFLGGGVGLADRGTMRTMTGPLRQGLRELGWIEGQTLQIERRLAGGRFDRLPALPAELIAWGPDMLVTSAPRRPCWLKRRRKRSRPSPSPSTTRCG